MARSDKKQREDELARAYDAARARATVPTVDLENELEDALEELHDHDNDGTAKSSVAHAVLMLRVWSLRFQIANRNYRDAADSEEKRTARGEMRIASEQLETWEKRKSVARADRVNDLLLAEQEHNAEQEAIAVEARTLQ